MIVDETIQEEAANCQDPIARNKLKRISTWTGSQSNALAPAKQVGGLDWSPRSFPYVTPLAIETRDPVPGDNGVWARS